MTTGMKTCCTCGIEKPLDEFYRSTVCQSRPDGYYRPCKTCHKAAARASGKRRRALATMAVEQIVNPAALRRPRKVGSTLTALGLKWCGAVGGAM